MTGDTQTRILVADDDARVHAAIRILLSQEPDRALVRGSAEADSLAIQVKEFRPHLVILDWELPGRPAVALLLALNGLDYRPKLMVLSTRPEAESDVLAAGADAFVCKGDPPERLLSSLGRLTQKSRAE